MSGKLLWISHVRFNGGPILASGDTCNLQIEAMTSPLIVPGQDPRRTGMRALLQFASFAPEDGYFECWGPNNPGGILDPVNPYGYVGLVLMTWQPTVMPDGAVVPHAYTGVQLAADVLAVAETGAVMPFNGVAQLPSLTSVDELAAAQIPDSPEEI